MKKIIAIALLVSSLAYIAYSQGSILDKAKNIISGKSGLTEKDAADGIKEALQTGSSKSVDKVSKTDGFLKNPAIKIPMPAEAKSMEKKLRGLGMGKEVDQAITSMNRAAELASKEATPIFVGAIKKMTVKDAVGIVKGKDDAATQYMKKQTTPELTAKFKPIIQKSLEQVDATKYYSNIATVYNKIPLVKKVNPDLTDYVTTKALDGLFKTLAGEEKEIRKNPAARTTDLLKKVFGK